ISRTSGATHRPRGRRIPARWARERAPRRGEDACRICKPVRSVHFLIKGRPESYAGHRTRTRFGARAHGWRGRVMAKRTKTATAPKRRSASETPLIARVNLVPHEYYTELKERKILRMLGLVVIGILLIGVAGSFGVGYLA